MPQRILVVDDEREIRRLVASYLIDDGFHVEELENGRLALERLGRTPDIDLVVLDVRMPELDGIDTLRELRKFSEVHVIMLTAAAEDSVKTLGVDHVDLYQTHWPDPETPLESVIGTLEALVAEGKIRAWGFCNSDPDSLRIAATNGSPATDQERYSLLDREEDERNLPVCLQENLGFLAYSPIAQGLLTGRIDGRREFGGGDLRRDSPRFAPRVLEAVQAVLAPVKALARDRDATVEQLVLAWTLGRPGVSHVLVGTRSVEQAVSNAAAGRLDLAAEELDVVEQAASAWPGFDALTSDA